MGPKPAKQLVSSQAQARSKKSFSAIFAHVYMSHSLTFHVSLTIGSKSISLPITTWPEPRHQHSQRLRAKVAADNGQLAFSIFLAQLFIFVFHLPIDNNEGSCPNPAGKH